MKMDCMALGCSSWARRSWRVPGGRQACRLRLAAADGPLLRLPDAPAVQVGPRRATAPPAACAWSPCARTAARPAAAGDGTALPAGAVRVSPERSSVECGSASWSASRHANRCGHRARRARRERRVPLVAAPTAGCAGCWADDRTLREEERVLLVVSTRRSSSTPSCRTSPASTTLAGRVASDRRATSASPNLAQPRRVRAADRRNPHDAEGQPVHRDRLAGRRLRPRSQGVASAALRRGTSSTASPTCARCGSSPTSTKTRRRSSALGEGPDHLPGPEPTFQATVSRAEPHFDTRTRTLKVRLETDNPGFTLRPGMFVDVEFAVELPPSLTVPAEAIVDSGLRKTVYVDRGNGYFEPRSVETAGGWATGWRSARGSMAGERIVISGTFLIDSESRMKAAGQGIFGARGQGPDLRHGGGREARGRGGQDVGARGARPTTSAPTTARSGSTRTRPNTPGRGDPPCR